MNIFVNLLYICVLLLLSQSCGIIEEVENAAKDSVKAPESSQNTIPFDANPVAAQFFEAYSDNVTNSFPRIDELNDGLFPLSQTIPNDPNWFNHPTKNIVNLYTRAHTALKSSDVWSISTDCRNIRIGVLDSSIDIIHSDLSENIFTNPGEISGNGIDDDGNGFIDDVNGWSFIKNSNKVYQESVLGANTIQNMITNGNLDIHGTHVTGILAAKGNNSKYISGVCWEANIIPIQMIDEDGAGSTSQALAAINYAQKMGVKVINGSWSGSGFDIELYYKMRNTSSILFIVASGNEAKNIDTNTVTPGSFGRIITSDGKGYSALENIISVGAADVNGSSIQNAAFSNFGINTVHISSPGKDILSLIPEGYVLYNGNNINQWVESGTSMAAPFVTGLAGLIWHQDTLLTPIEVKEKILSFSNRYDTLSTKVQNSRFLNLPHPLIPRGNSP